MSVLESMLESLRDPQTPSELVNDTRDGCAMFLWLVALPVTLSALIVLAACLYHPQSLRQRMLESVTHITEPQTTNL